MDCGSDDAFPAARALPLPAGQQHGLTFHFHQNLAGDDVEKLLRLGVVVANLGGSRRHELLDYAFAELFIVDEIPGIAIYSPTLISALGVFPAHRPGCGRGGLGRVPLLNRLGFLRHAFRLLRISVVLSP